MWLGSCYGWVLCGRCFCVLGRIGRIGNVVVRVVLHSESSCGLGKNVRAMSCCFLLNKNMRNLKDGIRSLVKIDYYGNVHKYFRGTDADKRAANEAKVLKVLEDRNCPNVPRLLEFHPDENYIVTTNCGSPAPRISKKKSDNLYAALKKKYGVIHDDPEPRNITYCDRMAEFCIIDFELATVIEDFKPL